MANSKPKSGARYALLCCGNDETCCSWSLIETVFGIMYSIPVELGRYNQYDMVSKALTLAVNIMFVICIVVYICITKKSPYEYSAVLYIAIIKSVVVVLTKLVYFIYMDDISWLYQNYIIYMLIGLYCVAIIFLVRDWRTLSEQRQERAGKILRITAAKEFLNHVDMLTERISCAEDHKEDTLVEVNALISNVTGQREPD